MLISSLSAYFTLLLVLINVWQQAVSNKLRLRDELLPTFSPVTLLKLMVGIPLAQLVCAIALWSAMLTQQVEWRGITYQVKGPWEIKLLEYFPYQYLNRSIEVLNSDRPVVLCHSLVQIIDEQEKPLNEPDFDLVGTANDGKATIELVEAQKPDIVIMDLEMPELNGINSTEIISEHFSQTKVVVYSDHDENCYISQSLEAGAKGYFLKRTPFAEISQGIKPKNNTMMPSGSVEFEN